MFSSKQSWITDSILFFVSFCTFWTLSITFRCLWYLKSPLDFKPKTAEKILATELSSQIAGCLINLTVHRERDRVASTSSWLYWWNENKLFFPAVQFAVEKGFNAADGSWSQLLLGSTLKSPFKLYAFFSQSDVHLAESIGQHSLLTAEALSECILRRHEADLIVCWGFKETARRVSEIQCCPDVASPLLPKYASNIIAVVFPCWIVRRLQDCTQSKCDVIIWTCFYFLVLLSFLRIFLWLHFIGISLLLKSFVNIWIISIFFCNTFSFMACACFSLFLSMNFGKALWNVF